MTNVVVLDVFKDRLARNRRVDLIDKFCSSMILIAGEQTQLTNSLLVVGNGLLDYIEQDIPAGSFWALSVGPALEVEVDTEGKPIPVTEPPKRIGIKFANGAAGPEILMDSVAAFGLGRIDCEVVEGPVRFAKLANIEPVVFFKQWIEKKGDVEKEATGVNIFINQIFPFGRILIRADEAGLKLDETSEDGDTLIMKLLGKDESLTMTFNFDHLRMTTTYLDTMAKAERS